MRIRKWWIKERQNPQLGTYWVAMGQMSKAAVKRAENSLCSDNVMHGFDTEQEYTQKLNELEAAGESVG